MSIKIKSIRERIGLSQAELGARLDVPQSTIACWETERAMPRAGKLRALADALGVTVDELLSEEE